MVPYGNHGTERDTVTLASTPWMYLIVKKAVYVQDGGKQKDYSQRMYLCIGTVYLEGRPIMCVYMGENINIGGSRMTQNKLPCHQAVGCYEMKHYNLCLEF